MRVDYVYMLASEKNGTLYAGVTNNLAKRVCEHKNNLIEGFTKKYNVKDLVYFETYDCIDSAILREKRMKKWRRVWNVKIIESMNPEWNDLYDEIPNF